VTVRSGVDEVRNEHRRECLAAMGARMGKLLESCCEELTGETLLISRFWIEEELQAGLEVFRIGLVRSQLTPSDN
jgi:hypothetical protein